MVRLSSVCLLASIVYSAKTAEVIEMPFGVVCGVSPRKRASDGSLDSPPAVGWIWGGANNEYTQRSKGA